MKRFGLLMIMASLLLMGACNKEKTTYQVDYKFDNTEMGSESLVVYECDSTGSVVNGKWRSNRHQYDTITTSEGQRIMASGHLDEVALTGCQQLVFYCEHMDGAQAYKLDTVFNLILLEENTITITPEMTWTKTY